MGGAYAGNTREDRTLHPNCFRRLSGFAVHQGDAQIGLKPPECTARNTLIKLTAAGYQVAASPKTPVRLVFVLGYRKRHVSILFGSGALTE